MSTQVRQVRLFVAEDWRIIYRAFTEVNFNAYDFDTIRRAMIDYMRLYYPEDFNDYINSSEFIAIIDLLAYLGQSLAFRTDINARENFIDDAERRESILKLARFLSYNPSRAQSARGLLKLTSVSTNDDILDSLGRSLSGEEIDWNDANNPDWFEQMVTVLNSAFRFTNPFGKPIKSGTVDGIKTQLYQFNSVAGAGVRYSFSAIIDGNNLVFDIVNTDFEDGVSFQEREPNPLAPFHLVYRSDGNGNSSSNTGFFMMLKEGDLSFEDFQLDIPISNRVIDIDTSSINNTDVWVQGINSQGVIIQRWAKVPAIFEQNIIFNEIPQNVRNIFSVITREEDSISIRFGDGRFGTVPLGTIRIWYRTTIGTSYQIRPQDITDIEIFMDYLNKNNQQKTLALKFSLFETIINASTSETDEQIKERAPQVYYTRNRMVNGEDYNVFPLKSNLAIKAKAVNRTYSGHSRYIDINDPTGYYQNTNVFSEDGIIYRQYDENYNEIMITDNRTADEIILSFIQPGINEIEVRNFFYKEYGYLTNIPNYLVWNKSPSPLYSGTGRFVSVSPEPDSVTGDSLKLLPGIQLGLNSPASSVYDFILEGSMVKFENGGWVLVQSIIGAGDNFEDNGRGQVTISENIEDNDYVLKILPAFRTALTSEEIDLLRDQINRKNSFGFRYDLPTSSWKIISANNLNQFDDFNLSLTGDNTGTNADSSWLLKMMYTGLSWQLSIRSLDYIFESVRDVRFFFLDKYKMVNQDTGLAEKDLIKVLKINPPPTGETLNNNIIGLGEDKEWNLYRSWSYNDGFVEPSKVYISFSDNDNDGVPDNPEMYDEIVGNQPSYIFWEEYTSPDGYEYQRSKNDIKSWKDSTNLNGLFIQKDEVVFFEDLLEFYKSLSLQEFNSNISFNSISSNFEIVEDTYIYRLGRRDMYFQWKHFAPTDHRIDPAITNLIDIYVLTDEYNYRIGLWKKTSLNLNDIPDPPTENQLRILFKEFEQYKMVSDEIIWHPVKYKLILGSSSPEEYRAKIKVIKIPEANISDGEIRTRVIELIDIFFDPSLWDFGETFYFSQLSAYIHQNMANLISSVVLVPTNQESRFGHLYQIQAESDELFLSTATVDDILIINSLTDTNLRIGN